MTKDEALTEILRILKELQKPPIDLSLIPHSQAQELLEVLDRINELMLPQSGSINS